jgi:ribosomal protein L7/L12
VAAFVAIIVAIGVTFVRLAELEKRLTALLHLDAKLDALLEHAGIQFDLLGSLPEGVVEALERGSKLEAVRHYLKAKGVSLKEAKDFIEDVQRRSARR